ncbi:hypothetical protein Daus18300_013446 [Diaporthe australafricana]|uniref:ARID domain-containing protein n=1 Tax=Diaporthe australafricana TaxID=127596 RepID=A0ABR3VYZ3_9PEZI
MELLRLQNAHSAEAAVKQYLEDANTSASGVEERSHLAQLCAECILLFQAILRAFGTDQDSGSKERKKLEISLRRSYGRMKIWSDENGAADGSLDGTLAVSRGLQRDTLRYVVSISQALTERLISFLDIKIDEAGQESISVVRSLTAAVADVDSDSSSDSGFSTFSASSVKGVLEDLRVDTTCLLDLEPLLRSPILSSDTEPTAALDAAQITWSPHQPYSDKVSARFPQAADDLVSRLGKANYERYLRCQEQKATNELDHRQSDQTSSFMLDNASSKFHDSGIGSSLPTTASSYAETVMSYGMGECRKVRVPPLPARGKAGLPFECVACGKWVKISTNSGWKQHVYGDLKPWICLEADCPTAHGTFSSRNDWVSHLALDHGMGPEWRMIECPLCRVETGSGKLSITRHMSDHLEEISLAALPVDCEFDEESDGSEPDVDGKDNLEPLVIPDSAWSVGLAQFPDCEKTLSPFDLKIAVKSLGGYAEVSKSERWGQVCLELGFRDEDLAEAASFLQVAYQRWIRPYEDSLADAEERDGEPFGGRGGIMKGTANARDPVSIITFAAVQSPIEEDKTGGYTDKVLAEQAEIDDPVGWSSTSKMPRLQDSPEAKQTRVISGSVPEIHIDYAPPTVSVGTGDGKSLDRETLSIPDREPQVLY